MFSYYFVECMQLMAEVVGTYFLIFAGCTSVVVNKNNDNVVTLPGISIVWGLAVTVLVYSTGHISGAHFNPAVTLAFASTKRFPLKQVNQTRPKYLSISLYYLIKFRKCSPSGSIIYKCHFPWSSSFFLSPQERQLLASVLLSNASLLFYSLVFFRLHPI